MKLVIPKQHGAWAMLVIPFLLSSYLGNLLCIIFHCFSLVLYLFSYVSISHVHKAKAKKEFLHAAIVYFMIAFIFGMISLLYEWRILLFVVVMIPFFIVNMYYARQKNERALLNDISAIIVFCIGG